MIECREGGPLAKYKGQDEDEICGGCKLVGSKPESVDAALISHIAVTLELNEVEDLGARFAYPDGLTVLEWQCLRSLGRGRTQADKLKKEREDKKKK